MRGAQAASLQIAGSLPGKTCKLENAFALGFIAKRFGKLP